MDSLFRDDFFNVNLTPNERMPVFPRKIDALKGTFLGTVGRILVEGDFNARAFE